MLSIFFKKHVGANTVSNGDFEVDAVPTGQTWVGLCPSSWSCSTTRLVTTADTNWGGGGNPSGSKYLAIQYSGSYITQTVQLQDTSPSIYLLQFYARNRPPTSCPSYTCGTASLSVSFNGATVWSQVPLTTWTYYQLTVTASSSTAVLQFTSWYSSGNSDATIELDNVMLQSCTAVGLCVGSGFNVFAYTGAVQTYAVPPGVASLTVTAAGAQGGYGGLGSTVSGSVPGYGGLIVATVSINPLSTLYVYVGGAGNSGMSTNTGGFNGGGSASCAGNSQWGGGGGGASDVRTGLGLLSSRLVVAGGGGGMYLHR